MSDAILFGDCGCCGPVLADRTRESVGALVIYYGVYPDGSVVQQWLNDLVGLIDSIPFPGVQDGLGGNLGWSIEFRYDASAPPPAQAVLEAGPGTITYSGYFGGLAATNYEVATFSRSFKVVKVRDVWAQSTRVCVWTTLTDSCSNLSTSSVIALPPIPTIGNPAQAALSYMSIITATDQPAHCCNFAP